MQRLHRFCYNLELVLRMTRRERLAGAAGAAAAAAADGGGGHDDGKRMVNVRRHETPQMLLCS